MIEGKSEKVEMDFDDGKYKVVLDGEQFYALRYNHTWRSLTGDKLISAMFYELQHKDEIIKQAQQQIVELEEQIKQAKYDVDHYSGLDEHRCQCSYCE